MTSLQKSEPYNVQRVTKKRVLESQMAVARRLVWARDGRRCRFCQRTVIRNPDPFRRGEVHHIVPRSRLAKGEYAKTSNLVLLCHEHHRMAQGYRLFIRGDANTVNLTFSEVRLV